MTIEIKEASSSEIDIVYHTMKEAFSEYIGKLNPPSGALSETTQDILNVINQGGGAIIAWDGLTAVGSTRYKFKDHYMYIGRVSVPPEFRGNGIFKQMLAFIEGLARERNLSETRVEVRLSIPVNVALYKKLEYEIIEHLYYPERTDSWYVMSKKGLFTTALKQ
jgi:ribosomal protein S18 acetylase RimI-like enzyme